MRKFYPLIVLAVLSLNLRAQTWDHAGDSLNSSAYALKVFNSKLFLGGSFTKVGTATAYGIAEFYDSAYSNYNTQPYSGTGIRCFEEHNGQLMAGGIFTCPSNGPAMCAIYNNHAITGTAYNLSADVYTLFSDTASLYAGGYFTELNSVGLNHVAQYDGTTWQPMGSGFDGTVFSIVKYKGAIIAGGAFTFSNMTMLNHIAQWGGSSWLPMAGGTNSTVYAMRVIGDDLYVLGDFTTAGGVASKFIAKWNGTSWSSVGGGLGGGYIGAFAILPTDSGIIVGGDFHQAGTIITHNVARFDGTEWKTVGPGISNTVRALTEFEGSIYAATRNDEETAYLLRFNPTGTNSGIPEHPGIASAFSIYPVPAGNTLYIEMLRPGSPDRNKLSICDMQGRVLYREPLAGPLTTIDISGLSDQVYVVKIESPEGVLVKRVIKHR